MADRSLWQREFPGSSEHQHGLDSHSVEIISSPERVFEVVRNFDQRKKEIVRSIGFGGILNLSRFSQLDPKFTLWIYGKARWKFNELAVCDKVKLPMKSEHIGKIMGIPCSGIEVKDKAIDNEDEKSAFMKLSLSFLGPGSQLLDSAEEYVAREVPFSCSKEDLNKFKVAFVIFVMGRFLSPSLDTSNPRSDFWGALKNPDSIHSFNWSSFVLNDTMDATRLVVWDKLRKNNVSAILGCPLILQIFYLDNIDLGLLNIPYGAHPRVKHFNTYVLRKMIQADIVVAGSSTSEDTYGRSKILRSDNICYSFHPSGSTVPQPAPSFESNQASPHMSTRKSDHAPRKVPCSGKQPSIHTDSPNHQQPFRSAVEFTGTDVPDFSLILREYFQGKVDSGLLECFRFHQAMCLKHFTNFINGLKASITWENIALVSKVVNHQRQTSGLAPIKLDLTRPSVTRRTYDEMLSGGESGNEGEDQTPVPNPSKYSRRTGGFETPAAKEHMPKLQDHQDASHPGNFTPPVINSRKPKLSLQNSLLHPTSENITFAGANLGGRMAGHACGVDLNERSLEAEYTNSPIQKKQVQPGGMVVPHWERNVDHPIREVALTHSFYDWVSTTTSSDLKNPWIIHDTPRYVRITGQQLKDYFTDIQPLAYDVFDLCVRRLRQLDKALCPKDVHLQWRHMIESDFSMHVLSGDTPFSNVSIRHQFVSTLIDYELERCRMFIVPVLVDGLWWCYAWDLKSLTLTISDPSVGQESDALVIQKHAGTIELVSKSLAETILEFYTGWHPKFQQCNTVVFRCKDMPIERSKSALFTLFFMKNFNGTNLVSTTTTNAMMKFKEYMLYEILEMKDNRAKPPSGYIQCIDD